MNDLGVLLQCLQKSRLPMPMLKERFSDVKIQKEKRQKRLYFSTLEFPKGDFKMWTIIESTEGCICLTEVSVHSALARPCVKYNSQVWGLQCRKDTQTRQSSVEGY